MTGPQDDPRDLPIVLASGNPKKLAEMREILGTLGLSVVGLNDLGDDLPEPEETGASFAENARIKALAYAEMTGRPSLADDSGLVVDALGGEPGVYSARYSESEHPGDLPRAQRDRLNNEKLMHRLGSTPSEQRTARFVCAMCLAVPMPSISGGGFQPPHSSHLHRELRIHQKGDLPHWRLTGATYFVTFNLLAGEMSDDERQFVLDACLFHHGRKWILHALTVMPDHVHLVARLLTSPVGKDYELSSVLHSVKSYSANQINLLRGESGTVWQRESYDRIMRNDRELRETLEYVELNPVRKDIVNQPGEYPWTLTQIDLRRRLEASATEKKATVLAESSGAFEGRIGLLGQVPRGGHGFGYDPLFLAAPDFARTSAELLPEEKHALSHRGQAARAIAARIAEFLRE